MKLWIFSTHKDLSLNRLVKEAENLSVTYEVVYFEFLSLQENVLVSIKNPVPIHPQDKILIRWPFDADNTDIEYNIFVHYLLFNYFNQVSFDRECLSKFSPYYEDKLFQSFVFEKLSVSTPKTFAFQAVDDLSLLQFPSVLKKRVSSRSKNNFLVKDISEVKDKLSGKDIQDYIFQEVVDIEHDIRIVGFKDEIIGAVKRYTHIREGSRLAVKGREVFTDIPDSVLSSIKKVRKFLGADFVGFDVLFDKNGRHYFIEANLSPQFDKFEEACNINLARKLIEEACLLQMMV